MNEQNNANIRFDPFDPLTFDFDVYDGNLVIQERDINNLPTTTYTRGTDLSGSLERAGGIGGLLARTAQSYVDAPLPGHSFYHADGNGNITMLINSSQAIVAKYLYDAFGNVLSKSGLLADANLYQFSSKEKDMPSGLVYYSYRYYDPNLQRWLNRDPIGEDGGINLYQFVANDPLDYVDPLGERWPDYYSFNINIAIPTPWTGTAFGWSGLLSVDRNGNVYWSPIGVGAGKSALVASCSLTANWLDRFSTPTPQNLNSFLTANGVSAGGGFIGGGSESYTPGSGWATGVGLYTPQGGVSWNYSFPVNQSGYQGHGAGSSW